MDASSGEWEWLANLANAATVLTGIAVIFAFVPFFQARKRQRQEADQWYVERYWQLQDLKRPRRRINGAIVVESSFGVRWAELRLCEDELDARANGWITNDSWKLWNGAILAHREDPMMTQIVQRTPGDELVQLRQFWSTGDDPISISPWRQFWRGLR
jgi:hypothetical protein